MRAATRKTPGARALGNSPIEFSNPSDVHAPVGPYSHTAVVPAGTELVFIAGQVGMRADGSIPMALGDQAEVTFQNLRSCLAEHGLGVEAVVKLGVFLVPGQDLALLRVARERHFGTHRPTSTTVYVSQLASPSFLLEVEAIAVKRKAARRAKKPNRTSAAGAGGG